MTKFRLVRKYEPIKITYINSRGREVVEYGAISDPTIYIGDKQYFRSLSDESILVKSINNDKSINVGKIIDFEYLEI